ncbi:hypothetical protein FO519_006191 [Halicephalobus sp. NKZ332]|nr:hypothetical protein FO519_006191 [Halicephalobus sp. NKZ332]
MSTVLQKADNYPEDELPLSKEMLTKLEQLSALRFKNVEEIESVEEDIRLAQKVFEVDTTGIEPLYSVVEEVINCPLRDDDVIEETSARNASFYFYTYLHISLITLHFRPYRMPR